MAYTLDGNEQQKSVPLGIVSSSIPMVKEHYIPTQNTDMIYIGIALALICLIILLYMLYRALQKEKRSV